MFAVAATGLLAVAIVGGTSAGPPETQARTALGLPVDCRLGEECFVQQMPDIDPHGGILDPLCGNASYRGHDGWDIRLRSLKDIGRTAVLSVADGTVLRVRDAVEIWSRRTEKTVAPDVPTLRLDNGIRLSRMERDILAHIVAGEDNIEVGKLLGISKQSVATHRWRITKKCGAKNSADLVRIVLSKLQS